MGRAHAVPASQINDFESPTEQAMLLPTPIPTKVVNTFVSSPTAGVAHGSKALNVNFKANSGTWLTSTMTLPSAQNWSATAGALAMSIHNPGTSDVTFYVVLSDNTDTLLWINKVKAGESVNVQQCLTTQEEFKKAAASTDWMAKYGLSKPPWIGLGTDKPVYVNDNSPPNRAAITKVSFQMEAAPTSDVNLVIDNMHLVPGPRFDQNYSPTPVNINSFETTTEQNLVNGTHPGVTVTYQTTPGGGMTLDGTKVMKLVWAANSGVNWPGVKLAPPEVPADWLGVPAAGLAMNVYNSSGAALSLACKVVDESGASKTSYFTVNAATAGKWVMPLHSKAGLGISGVTDMTAGAGSVDWQHISQIVLFYAPNPGPSTSFTAYVDHVRLVKGNVLTGIVDKYGQYTRDDWPGKVYSDSDLTSARSSEASALAASPSMSNRDSYGGWTLNPSGLGSGNGYFRTWYDSTRSKWWLVDPLGNRFFSTGTTCTSLDLDKTVIKNTHQTSPPPITLDRTSWFQPGALPVQGSSDPLAAFYTETTNGAVPFDKGGLAYDFFQANVYRKYYPGSGVDWQADWKLTQQARMKSWGFNTLAAWSALAGQIDVPFTIAITTAGTNVKTFFSPFQVHSEMRDPWDTADMKAAILYNLNHASAGVHKTNPKLIGYFVDNELGWGLDTWNPAYKHYQQFTIPWGVMMYDNNGGAGQLPAKNILIADLQTKYGTVAALNAAWGTSFNTASTITAVLQAPYDPNPTNRGAVVLTAGHVTDYRNFLTKYARKYFENVSTTINEFEDSTAPYQRNHLYLGCRFAQWNLEAIKACTEYADVVSFNIYGMFDNAKWAFLSDTSVIPIQKPAIVGEFAFLAQDRGLFGPTNDILTQAQRVSNYDLYMSRVATHENFVGAHWFQYVDEPLLGRHLDNEAGNFGYLSTTDTPYPELVAQTKSVHSTIYSDRY
jgi:hypothetical protein